MAKAESNVDPRRKATIEDTEMRFRNFSGIGGPMNAPGKRNFCILLPDATANAMKADGWNIKYLQPKEEGDREQAYMKVNVNFDSKEPPQIVLITSGGRTQLNSATVGMLDLADIIHTDLIISPYDWSRNGESGRSAYLHKLFVTIEEDILERKYADTLGSAQTCVGDECELPVL